MTAAELLVACLAEQGCESIFTVPGESFLPVLDALHGHATIETVTCRQEAFARDGEDALAALLGEAGDEDFGSSHERDLAAPKGSRNRPPFAPSVPSVDSNQAGPVPWLRNR